MKKYILKFWNYLTELFKLKNNKQIEELQNKLKELQDELNEFKGDEKEANTPYYIHDIDVEHLDDEGKKLYEIIQTEFNFKGVKGVKSRIDALFVASNTVKAHVEYDKQITLLRDKQELLDGIIELFNNYVNNKIDLALEIKKRDKKSMELTDLDRQTIKKTLIEDFKIAETKEINELRSALNNNKLKPENVII